MPGQEILYETGGGVATITLNRPDKLNAWTLPMEAAYREAMGEAAADDGVRVIVVTGAGRGFCAGADLSLLQKVGQGPVTEADLAPDAPLPIAADAPADFQKQYAFPLAIPKPIIAAVNGPAVGLGLVHALYCDIRFAADTAKFSTAFAQRGLVAEHGSAWLLPRLVGPAHAFDLMFSGRMIDAAEAGRMGLVNRVVPADALMNEVRAYAETMAAQCSPRALADMKREMYRAMITALGPAYDEAVADMLKSFESADFLEGVAAFMEKRPPRWTGR